MKLNNINNPVYYELLNLKLIKKKNLNIFWNKTRDSKIKSYIDRKTEVIFLEKFIKNEVFYKRKKTTRTFFKNRSLSNIKIKKKKIITKNLDDDFRRYSDYKKILKNKKILDFGCGKGRFIKFCQKISKYNYAVEVNDYYINELKKSVKVNRNIEDFEGIKFDIITMFHVLEHLPNQVDTIKLLLKHLKKTGILIIEVPSAHDFLFKIKNLDSFKNFTMWSEHLILHTHNSLKKICIAAGAKKIKIDFFQRYNFSNHFGWIVDGLPGGHEKYMFDKKINSVYQSFLEKNKTSDTLIATIKK